MRYLTLVVACALARIVTGCAAPQPVLDADGVLAPADTVRGEAFGPTFRDGRYIAADPQGRLYVSDVGSDVVYRLAPDGSVLSTLGGPGSGDYAFLTPGGLDPTNGLVLFVADAGNGRVQRFSHEGRFLESIVVPADPDVVLGRRVENVEPGRPADVVVAPAGEVYVLEAMRGLVLLYDERRSLSRVIGGPGEGRGALHRPVALALDPDNRLLVADAGHRAVLVYDAYGEFLRRFADGTARDVRAVAADREEIVVFLADRVVVYGLDGTLAGSIAVDLPEPLVGGTLCEGELVLVTRTSLWRLRR